MTVSEIPNLWIKEELKKQRALLNKVEKAKQYGNIQSYKNFVCMLNEIVCICEKYALNINKNE